MLKTSKIIKKFSMPINHDKQDQVPKRVLDKCISLSSSANELLRHFYASKRAPERSRLLKKALEDIQSKIILFEKADLSLYPEVNKLFDSVDVKCKKECKFCSKEINLI